MHKKYVNKLKLLKVSFGVKVHTFLDQCGKGSDLGVRGSAQVHNTTLLTSWLYNWTVNQINSLTDTPSHVFYCKAGTFAQPTS